MNRVADKNGMIARRATPVAATTRYWRSQPFAGVAACCHFRTSRFAHRVMAAVILRCQGVQHSERPFLSQPIGALALRAVCGVRLLIRLLAIRLSWQTTPTKSLVIAKGMTIRVSPLLNPLPQAGEEAIVLSPTCGGKLERGLAFLAMPSRHVTAQQPIAGARAGRPSRTKCYAPPCPACNPAKPSARPYGT